MRHLTLCKLTDSFAKYLLDNGYTHPLLDYTNKKSYTFTYIGEIPNMLDYHVVATIHDGKIIVGVQLEDMEELMEELNEDEV